MGNKATRHINEDAVKPRSIANEILKQFDPENKTPPLIRSLVLTELTKRVSAEIRVNRKDSDDKEMRELWPSLQARYPIHRPTADVEPTYVKLEELEPSDILWNVNRLTKEADTKHMHSLALRQMLREKMN